MTIADSHVTIHMVASLDGFIARTDGSVDWLETSDEFMDGATMDPGFVEAFLDTIDCYVMGSRTYETAVAFEAKGLGWAYADKPTFVLTHGGSELCAECLRLDLADVKAYRNGMVELRYEVRRDSLTPRSHRPPAASQT